MFPTATRSNMNSRGLPRYLRSVYPTATRSNLKMPGDDEAFRRNGYVALKMRKAQRFLTFDRDAVGCLILLCPGKTPAIHIRPRCGRVTISGLF